MPLTVLLYGCVSTSDPATEIERFNAPYDKVGACIYDRASGESMVGLHFADLRGTKRIVIRRMNENILVWEATIIPDGNSSTRVEIRAMPTVYGRDYYVKQISQYVLSCL